MSEKRVIVLAEYRGQRKYHLWDLKAPLLLRTPVTVALVASGSDVFYSVAGEWKALGELSGDVSLNVVPSSGAKLTVTPLIPQDRRSKFAGAVPKDSEFARLASAALLSFVAGAAMLFPYLSTSNRPTSELPSTREIPTANVRVEALPPNLEAIRHASAPAPVKVSEPVAAPISKVEVPSPSIVDQKSRPTRSSVAKMAGEGGAPSASLEAGSKEQKGMGLAQRRGANRIKTSARTASERSGIALKESSDLLRNSLGDVLGKGGAGAKAEVAPGGKTKTRFGFGGNGSADEVNGNLQGTSGAIPPRARETAAVQSKKEAIAKINDTFEPEEPRAVDPQLNLAKNYVQGAGELAKVKGQGQVQVSLQSRDLAVTEGLVHSEVENTIQARIGEIRRCYEAGNRVGTQFKGKIMVSFRIRANGSSADANFEGADRMSSPMRECMLRTVESWRFPKPRGGREVEVRYPFMFLMVEGESG